MEPWLDSDDVGSGGGVTEYNAMYRVLRSAYTFCTEHTLLQQALTQ